MDLEEAGTVLPPFEAGLDQRGQFIDAVFGQVGQGPLQLRPHAQTGFSSGAYGGSW
jgi:hypothetical protein